jgi:hypothetical protein
VVCRDPPHNLCLCLGVFRAGFRVMRRNCHRRHMLSARVLMPIVASAGTRPLVRTKVSPMSLVCAPKACLTCTRTVGFVLSGPLCAMTVEQLEQPLRLTGLRQRASIKPTRRGVRQAVPLAKPQQSHQGKPFRYLMFDPVVRTVLKCPQDPRLEHGHCDIGLHQLRSKAGRNSSHGTAASIPGSGVFLAFRLGSRSKRSKTQPVPSQHSPARLRLNHLAEVT